MSKQLWLGLVFGEPGANGSVTIAEVDQGGPVAAAGGKAGDVLLLVDGRSAMDARRGWHDGSRPAVAGVRMSWMVERNAEKLVLCPAWAEIGQSGFNASATAPGRSDGNSGDPYAGMFSGGPVTVPRIARPLVTTELIGYSGDSVCPDRCRNVPATSLGSRSRRSVRGIVMRNLRRLSAGCSIGDGWIDRLVSYRTCENRQMFRKTKQMFQREPRIIAPRWRNGRHGSMSTGLSRLVRTVPISRGVRSRRSAVTRVLPRASADDAHVRVRKNSFRTCEEPLISVLLRQNQRRRSAPRLLRQVLVDPSFSKGDGRVNWTWGI
jgi:hypothetical protein